MFEPGSAYTQRASTLGFQFPRLLYPRRGTDLTRWSVIACDQHTSDREYWKKVEAEVGQAPSTLRLIFPEVYLEDRDGDARIAAIHENMKSYLSSSLLEGGSPGLVYLERRTEASGLRAGVLLAMDLERYDYSADSRSLIRATEGTILERIPPRVKIRKGAPIELPHIMILIDDKSRSLIEGIGNEKETLTPLYDIDLMLGGGRLSAWSVDRPEIVDSLLLGLEALAAPEYARSSFGIDQPFLFAMGDGNHSLATAKTVWEEMKKECLKREGSWDSIASHPARWALAEIVNLHSPGLRFEPIHRVLFKTDLEGYASILRDHFACELVPSREEDARRLLEKDLDGQGCAVLFGAGKYFIVRFPEGTKKLPNALIDQAFDHYRQILPEAQIDFVHGWEHSKKAGRDGLVLFMPVIARERLFSYVAQQGPLPRKAFSMGDAEEKRYYVEARQILPS